MKTKKSKKTIWNRLTPDSSHRIVFFVSFWFSLTFWTYGKVEMKKGKKHEKTKDAKTQRSQRPFLKKNNNNNNMELQNEGLVDDARKSSMCSL